MFKSSVETSSPRSQNLFGFCKRKKFVAKPCNELRFNIMVEEVERIISSSLPILKKYNLTTPMIFIPSELINIELLKSLEKLGFIDPKSKGESLES